MKFTKLRKAGIYFGAFLGITFVGVFGFFNWNIVPYPSNPAYGPFVCYSPNHEYYIKRYQTALMSLTDQLYANGIAILYDKSGKKIYKGHASFSDDPHWHRDSVGFLGTYEWSVNLPSSPGTHPERDEGCFDEISNYVKVQPPQLPPRKLIIKAVEPLKKTNSPYQLQFLIEDQNNSPFTSFHYLITRADGSRQYGKTDENGRTVTIESKAEESVVLFHPPTQDIENYDSPESLTKCIKTKYTVCFDPKIYTVTANTIKTGSGASK